VFFRHAAFSLPRTADKLDCMANAVFAALLGPASKQFAVELIPLFTTAVLRADEPFNTNEL
jgi:hypothetical protein